MRLMTYLCGNWLAAAGSVSSVKCPHRMAGLSGLPVQLSSAGIVQTHRQTIISKEIPASPASHDYNFVAEWSFRP